MSSLMGSGADCSVGSNPLSQLVKHVGVGKSHQQDKFSEGSSSQGMMEPSMRVVSNQGMGIVEERAMEQFLSSNGHSGLTELPEERIFDYNLMRNELMGIQTNVARQHPTVSYSLATSTMNVPVTGGGQWSKEFATSSSVNDTQHHSSSSVGQNHQYQYHHQSANFPTFNRYSNYDSINQPMSYMNGMMQFERPFMGGMEYMHHQQPTYEPSVNQKSNGKERLVELDSTDWESQFSSIEADNETVTPLSDNLHDRYSGETLDETFHGDFENIWRGIQEQNLENGTAKIVGGENNIDLTYENLFEGDRGLGGVENHDELKMPWDRDFEEYATSRPDSGDYHFEPENKFIQEDFSDPFAEGVRIMETGGNLSEAALAFEAAVQKNPEHIEAWSRLGEVQAQNEKEDPAIRAFERTLQLDPSNQIALQNLAVSYINEGFENAAYATLERWIATKYPRIIAQARRQEPELADADQFRLHERVTELYLRAAQLSPEGMSMDPDVQVGLGILFYGSEEYDKAIDCFNAALSVRPDDHLLWNRLGATLANSQRSEEAIEAYYKALEIRPSFVRARYNLGVSCINIGCYKEAAQHIINGLEMHRVPIDDGVANREDILANQSTVLYETLRRIFFAMDRRDLADKVVTGVDPMVFKDAF
ncbi:hypothetical protein V1511DRAFT_455628 [Dipodascopsis uninucleata]